MTPFGWSRRLLDARIAGYVAGLALVGLMSVLIGQLQTWVHVANISMFYLVAVLATAVFFGSGPAILASFVAFLTFDWFFVEPLYAFTVSDPSEWVSLVHFLLTAIITGQLTALVRKRALEAEQREHEAAVMYDVVRLMTQPGLDAALRDVAARLRAELDLAAVVIDLDGGDGVAARAEVGDPDAVSQGQSVALAPSTILGKGQEPSARHRGSPGRWVKIMPSSPPFLDLAPIPNRLHRVPITARDQRLGTLAVVRRLDGAPFRPAETRLLSAVSVQLGLAAETVRLRREATETEILRRTDELKTALINAVSHDLRTPLASIIASAGSLRQRDVAWTDAERREFTMAIEEEALRLNRIVGNLLDLSRVEGGSLRPEKGWYDLGALVDDVLGRLKPVIAGSQVTADVADDLPPIPLDYVEIDQVLSNLIENAAKYTPRGSHIEVSARVIGDAVEVAVADDGPGVPLGALPRLFDPFYRASGSGPRPSGTGVGLAVAKGLVEAHGGRIWAENRRDGGARFAFVLPLNPVEAIPSEKARAS